MKRFLVLGALPLALAAAVNGAAYAQTSVFDAIALQTSVYSAGFLLRDTPEKCQQAWKGRLESNGFTIYPATEEQKKNKDNRELFASKKGTPISVHVACSGTKGVLNIGISGTNWGEMIKVYDALWSEPEKKTK